MKKKLVYFLTVIFSLIVLGFVSLKLVKRLPEQPRRLANDIYLKVIAQANNFVDYLYPKTYLHFFKNKNLPHYGLIVSQSSLDNLNLDVAQALKDNYLSKKTLHQEKIDLIFQNQTYPASLSLHGSTKGNYKYSKKSYSIKLKDNQTINNANRFCLINSFQHDFITPLLANSVAERLKLYFNQQSPVTVSLNKSYQGIYLYEEELDQNFLAKRNLTQAQIIKLKDTWAEHHHNDPNTFGLNAHHLSAFDFEISNVEALDDQSPATLYQLDKFFTAIKDKNLNSLLNYLDLDYMARYDAYREFFAIDHDTAGDNLKFIYLAPEQRFYPIVRNEGEINQLRLSQGSLLASYNSYDPHISGQFDYPKLFLILNQDPEFRRLKYQYLNQLVQAYPTIKADFKQIYQDYAEIFIYDPKDDISIYAKKKMLQQFLAMIDSNVSLIKQQLNFAAVFINIVNHGSSTTIAIIPDSVAPISFNQFELSFSLPLNQAPARLNQQAIALNQKTDISQLINSQIILPQYDQDMHLVPTTYTYQLTANYPLTVTALQVKAINQTTGTPIDDLHFAIASP